MFLTLNLIPQEFKRELALHAAYILLKKFFILLFCVLFITSASLFFARIYLKEKLDELTTQSQALSFQTKDIKEKVTTLNSILTGTRQVLESTRAWAPTLDAIESNIPSDISVNSILLTTETSPATIQLTGTSPSRDVYLAFEQSLKKLPFIASVSSPIQNILSTDENPFALTLILAMDN